MGSRVVLVTKVRSSLGVAGEHDGLQVADLRHPDAVETTLRSIHAGGDLPLVTCRSEEYEEVRRLVTFAQVRFPGLRAPVTAIPGQPMVAAVISSLVDDLRAEDEQDSTAWRFEALHHLRERAWSAVWLPSVGALRQPSPSIVQHVRSWLPGSGFLAVDGDPGRVLKAHRAPVKGLDPRPDTVLLHSPTQASNAWVVDAIASALGAGSRSEVTAVREQVDAFGTDRAVELVAVPQAYDAATRPDPAALTTCPACELRHARPTCPACHMTAEPVAVRSAPRGDIQ